MQYILAHLASSASNEIFLCISRPYTCLCILWAQEYLCVRWVTYGTLRKYDSQSMLIDNAVRCYHKFSNLFFAKELQFFCFYSIFMQLKWLAFYFFLQIRS